MIYLLKLERTQTVWGLIPSTEIIGVFDSMEKLQKAKAESTWNKVITDSPEDDWEWEIEEMNINQLNTQSTRYE
jgi:hypothetical protein|tara:strand:- start:394 stop:615 length:222 start_codon:yes stop_codon:yes gene_type:complete